jgi:hypothetical protein
VKIIDVIVVGAGAAGLFCAAIAAERGRSVLLLDCANKVGKKILMSGGGRCNFTNLDITPEKFLSNNPHFCISALRRYTQWDFIDLVEHHGIAFHERQHGELFCDRSSKDILNMLLAECQRHGVSVRTSVAIDSVSSLTRSDRSDEICESRYAVHTKEGEYGCESLVVATGGLSIPTLGGSGFGYQLAEQFDLRLLPRSAGLVPFTFGGELGEAFANLSGTSVDVEMSCQGANFRGNMLFTHRGISGPSALQLSSYWRPGQPIGINLLPDIDIYPWLLRMKTEYPKTFLRTLFQQHLPKALAQLLEQRFWPAKREQPVAEIANADLTDVAQQCADWQLVPAGTEGYRTAEVTLCGVDSDELSSKTMMSRRHPGLYFIGEVVDVTGHLGGYNFQWAWSSGYAAGQAV